MSLVKYIETGTYFYDTGEQTVTPLVPYTVTESFLTKQASEISEFLRDLKADVDKLYLHINAMGASDHWGMNANGDVFSEEQLLGSHKTFEQFGNVYKHHQNKPDQGHKIYGKVLLAHYNPVMHRVELIAAIDKLAAPDIVDDIADGKDVAVSMAIKVPYDTCTIRGCGNVAKTRGQYCEHGKTMLTKILDDGQQVGRINPNGKFFDISKVFRPADRTGYVLRKVASAGYIVPSAELADINGIEDPWPNEGMPKKEPVLRPAMQEKLAQVRKLASIEKEISGEVSGATATSNSTPVVRSIKIIKITAPRISEPDLTTLAGVPTELVLKKMLEYKIDPEYSEFARICGKEDDTPCTYGFNFLADNPELFERAYDDLADHEKQSFRLNDINTVDQIFSKYAACRSIADNVDEIMAKLVFEKQACTVGTLETNMRKMAASAGSLPVLYYTQKLRLLEKTARLSDLATEENVGYALAARDWLKTVLGKDYVIVPRTSLKSANQLNNK